MGIRGGGAPLGAQIDDLVGQDARRLAERPGLAQAVHHDGVIQQAPLLGDLRQTVQGDGGPGIAGRAHAFELQRVAHHFPALVLGPQARTHGHTHIGKEDLVEIALPHHRGDLADLDARCVHGDEQDRDAPMPPAIRIGPDQQDDEVRVIAIRGPDLGSVDHIIVFHPKGLGAQCGEIAARLGFREALAPEHVAGGNARQVLGLLGLGPVGHDGGADPVDVHVLGAPGLADGPHFLPHHGMAPGRGVLAAIFLGPVLGQPATLGHAPAKMPGERRLGIAPWSVLGDRLPVGGQLLGEEVAQLLAVPRIVLCPVELHACASLSGSTSGDPASG